VANGNAREGIDKVPPLVRFRTASHSHWRHIGSHIVAFSNQTALDATASKIAAETGLTYRPVADGSPVSGVYRRAVTLASGRFAMLEDGLGFSLVPWRPIVEQRLGTSLRAVVRGDSVSWDLRRQRGISL
jgi:Protein of unknown function (DUF3363)